MTKIEELQEQIKEMRENGAEQEDIAQVVQELNMEIMKDKKQTAPSSKGGGDSG